jgi:hypothetical protein
MFRIALSYDKCCQAIKIDKEDLKEIKDPKVTKSDEHSGLRQVDLFEIPAVPVLTLSELKVNVEREEESFRNLTDFAICAASELKKDKENGKIGLKIINDSAYVATRCKYSCNYNDRNYYKFFGIYNSKLLEERICPIIENKNDLININNDSASVIFTNKSEISKINKENKGFEELNIFFVPYFELFSP